MLSIGLMRDDWRSDTGGVFLRLFLIAAVGAPVVGAAAGRELARPFGFSLTQLAVLMAASGTAYALWRLRRSPTDGLLRVEIDVVALAALAGTFVLIIDGASNIFYTQQVLADAMAVLLLLHLAGAALRALGRNRQRWPRLTVLRGDGTPAVPARSEPASMQFADGLTAGMTLLVGCFWGLAVNGLHEGAGVLLILAGALAGLVIIARLPSAFINERVLFHEWRVMRRSRRPNRGTSRHEGSHVHGS